MNCDNFVPCSLLPTHYSLFPVPCSLFPLVYLKLNDLVKPSFHENYPCEYDYSLQRR
ncbi:MAG: hypothetical protein F6K50_27975 [Moorea sp. SIO3I7]|uniref:hypothetical protein n=1 Tax=unclassified Moorena TaxID=2683338 RepID=UPI0013C0452F|nr:MULTISPECIES: hypothetical protein [unclassified Moorena]NEN99179.1 hypothetical protein [Moorena sp. SIO3I7]NEO04544.1 hypothetical protein [Moorena sp. SIO3I8]NEO19040.1 hypothetical protein [Moorena sp. SIO4A5]NEP26577.1 hypothetical protein [Moorena sp. SIO3I6]NEQ56382.1 hypothetical protein [Moorena sp. SIO4A1]